MIDKTLFMAVMFLLSVSLMMTYSLSVYAVVHFEYSSTHFFVRQLMAVTIGFLSIIVLSRLDPDRWFIPLGISVFLFFFLLMFAMQFFPSSIVRSVGGAKRWIHAGPLSIAPVEFFKIGFVFFLAWSFSRKLLYRKKMKFIEEIRATSPYLAVFLVAVVLIAILQKDLGQTAVLGVTLLIMFSFAGTSLRFFLLLIGSGMIAFIGLVVMAPHRIERVKGWWVSIQDSILALFPFEKMQSLRVETVTKEPYQVSNSLNAINNGGYFGVGLGNGQFKLGYLSDVHTDFVLAGIAEEFGLFGLAIVTFVTLFIIFRLFKIAAKLSNPVYYLFCIGVALLITLAFIMNSFGISGITPVKGIAVPFLSYGGSQILSLCIAIGMVLMVSKKRYQ
ncbi:MAG: FtsW/RodA/SpoVE family cell cycle protein [Campylobacterales bacterium]|nr:FtsW/RodA/SpoVE family cell cycle protein [Campylobacterales bacterium]